MILANKKILVTGGAGFIGSNLVERFLNQNNEVTILDNFSTGKRENIVPLLKNKKLNLVEGDICNMDDCIKAIDGVEIVFHQAALGSVPRSIEDPIKTNEVNINGFLNMLVACSKSKDVKRFIYAASSSTYGDSKELPKVEQNIGKPLSPYAVTKLVNELYAEVFGKLYGLDTIGLRYFNVFGRRQDPDGAYAAAIPKFIKSLISHESPTIHGDGSQTRDFTYIENVIHANERAALVEDRNALNQVYNIAYGEETLLNDLVNKLQLLLSSFDPAIKEVAIHYGDEREGDVKYSLASIEKAKNLLGYNPIYDLNKGLTEAIDWYWNNLS